jgi:hypothetical protein
MKGFDYYYHEFESILNSEKPKLAGEFKIFLSKHSHEPNKVFMWLEEKRKLGTLPMSMEECLTNFYWEIR